MAPIVTTTITRSPLAAWLEEATESTILIDRDLTAWQKGSNLWWAAGDTVPRESFDLVGSAPFTVLHLGA